MRAIAWQMTGLLKHVGGEPELAHHAARQLLQRGAIPLTTHDEDKVSAEQDPHKRRLMAQSLPKVPH